MSMIEADAKKLLAQARDLSARYARRLGPDEAADLVNEAVARGLERPPADGRMNPWLERIARNLLVDRWRRAEVARRAELPPPEGAPSPEDLLLHGERRRLLRRSLARLPRDQRRSILQRYYTGVPPAGVAAATLRTRLHRGLTRLRALTRGLLAIVPPVRLFGWAALAVNPAAVLVLVLAQQAPLPALTVAPPPASAPQRAFARPSPAPPPARAHAPAPAPASHPAAAIRPAAALAAPVHYAFEDDQIDGKLQAPDGDRVPVIRTTRHSSLIEIPDSFVPAIAKSVEDL